MNTPIHRALLMSITLLTAATTHLYAASRDTPTNVDKTTLSLAANSTIELIEINEIYSTPQVLVEAILFSNNKQPETREITWLTGNRAQVPENTAEPNLSPLVRSYQRSNELLQMAQKINDSTHYTMISNQAWLQPVAKDDQQSPVRLKLTWQDYDIDGAIAVFKSRSLHVMSDVWITRTPSDETIETTDKANTELVVIPSTIPTSDPSELATNDPLQADHTNTDPGVPSVNYAPVTARLTETRRIQNNQWNFFDHPNFGLLLKVSKFDD